MCVCLVYLVLLCSSLLFDYGFGCDFSIVRHQEHHFNLMTPTHTMKDPRLETKMEESLHPNRLPQRTPMLRLKQNASHCHLCLC